MKERKKRGREINTRKIEGRERKKTKKDEGGKIRLTRD